MELTEKGRYEERESVFLDYLKLENFMFALFSSRFPRWNMSAVLLVCVRPHSGSGEGRGQASQFGNRKGN